MTRFIYDGECDTLTIEFREGLAAKTIEVEPGATLLDLDADGKALALEIINPARWPPFLELAGLERGEWMCV